MLVSYVAAVVWRYFHNQLYWDWVKQGYTPENFMHNLDGLTGSFYVLLCWSGLYFGIKYHRQLQEQTEQTLRATAAAHQAQLMALRYQLNPHFLFNTLNAISTLILDRDNETANLSVTRLSDFLRYSLDNDPALMIPLEQEIEAVMLYLDIEKIRFGERLKLEMEVDELAARARVPSLLLQPLVENSVKHAISANEEGGTISLVAGVEGEYLHLELTDTGPDRSSKAVEPASERQVGLKNTLQRLKTLYNDAYVFDIQPRKSSPGLRIVIRIPFEEA